MLKIRSGYIELEKYIQYMWKCYGIHGRFLVGMCESSGLFKDISLDVKRTLKLI